MYKRQVAGISLQPSEFVKIIFVFFVAGMFHQSNSFRQDVYKRQLYDLKHELISVQIKAETSEKTVKELETQNKELQLNKSKLEAALEDALLG